MKREPNAELKLRVAAELADAQRARIREQDDEIKRLRAEAEAMKIVLEAVTASRNAVIDVQRKHLRAKLGLEDRPIAEQNEPNPPELLALAYGGSR